MLVSETLGACQCKRYKPDPIYITVLPDPLLSTELYELGIYLRGYALAELKCRNFAINPTVLLTLMILRSMWCFQDKFSSITIPRYLT